MFTFNVDLGQTIIAGLIGVSGYLVKRTIDKFDSRLDRHEQTIFIIAQEVQKLVGYNAALRGDRRQRERE